MIRVIRNPDEMHALKHEWNKLAEPFKTPTLQYEWFAASAEAFCQSGQLRIIVNGSSREINAIAPLVLTRSNGVEKLEVLGMSALFETGGFIYRDEDSLRELLSSVLKMKKPLVFRRLRAESPEITLLQELCRNRGRLRLIKDAGSLFVPTNMNWNEFESGMSARSRAGLRRKQRQAEKKGRVDFDVVSPDSDALDPYLQEALRVESSGWKGRNGTAILSMPLLRKFFTIYSQEAARLGMLRIFFLKIGGETVAVRLAVEYANRLWELKIGYDEHWASCSPGLLLTHETLKYACKKGLDAFEFLGTDEPWIRMWTDNAHAHASLQVYPSTFAGMLSYGIDIARIAAGKMLRYKF